MTWSLSVNQLTAKDMQHCLQHFDDKWTLTRDHPTCKLLGASEIVTTRTLKSHYLYTGFIFKSTLTASSMGQGEDFSMIFFFLKKSDYDHSVSKYSAQVSPQEPAARPHCTALIHQNCAGLWENKACQERAGNYHKFTLIQVNESTPPPVHGWRTPVGTQFW